MLDSARFIVRVCIMLDSARDFGVCSEGLVQKWGFTHIKMGPIYNLSQIDVLQTDMSRLIIRHTLKVNIHNFLKLLQFYPLPCLFSNNAYRLRKPLVNSCTLLAMQFGKAQ